MGGYGSGRWRNHQKAVCVEQCAVYNITDFRSRLKAHPDEVIPAKVDLFYKSTYGEAQQQSISLATCPRKLGGVEQYFLCPGCQRRCKKLYRPGKGISYCCRICLGLSYRSSQESHKYDKAAAIPLLADLFHQEKVLTAYQRIKSARGKRAIERAGKAFQKISESQ